MFWQLVLQYLEVKLNEKPVLLWYQSKQCPNIKVTVHVYDKALMNNDVTINIMSAIDSKYQQNDATDMSGACAQVVHFLLLNIGTLNLELVWSVAVIANTYHQAQERCWVNERLSWSRKLNVETGVILKLQKGVLQCYMQGYSTVWTIFIFQEREYRQHTIARCTM